MKLTWSTKYERPKAPARSEPSNFGQLISAVKQSIVPKDVPAPASPSISSASLSGRPSESATPPVSYRQSASTKATGVEPVRTRHNKRHASVTGIPVTSSAVPAMVKSSPAPSPSPTLVNGIVHMFHSSPARPDVHEFVDNPFPLDLVAGRLTFTPDDSTWAHSSTADSSPGPSSSASRSELDNMTMLAALSEVDETETSVDGIAGGMVNVRQPTTRHATSGVGYLQMAAPQLPRQLVDVSSFLIQHWFQTVCCGWSAYDTQANPYRQLAASLWQTSQAVYYALQSMAAAHLDEHLPHLKQVSQRAPRLASDAIMQEINFFWSSKPPRAFPRTLVLALFCMSSSICWTDSRQFGLQFLKVGRQVLNHLDRCADALSPNDRQLLDFFNGCLVYEEMLRSIVSNDAGDMETLTSWRVSPAESVSVTPHAWTGVSPDILRLLGKTMFLCRRSRNRWRHPYHTVDEKMLDESMDYHESTVIEEVLLATELPDPAPPRQDAAMGEQAELRRHLHDAAEAYRLSALLQLYLTFPGLIVNRLPSLAEAASFTVGTALHITNILRRIPPSSSMRCLQPLLVLFAATGLRYNPLVPNQPGVQDQFPRSDLFPGAVAPGLGLNNSLGTASPSPYGLSSIDFTIGEDELEIASARRFLMDRLGRLEQSLAPKPIQVEKQLLRSIWETYDAEIANQCKTHWLDIMVERGLESIFG